MNRPKVADPPPLHHYWLFPPGPATEVYYIALSNVDEGPGAESLERHVARAWAGDAPVDEFCVARAGNGFWVQVLGHANFRVVMKYLKDHGRFVAGGEAKIAETNEAASIALLVNEHQAPRRHFAIYAAARIRADGRLSPDVLRQPADTCAHVFAVRHDPRGRMCSRCRAAVERERADACARLRAPKLAPDEPFEPDAGGTMVCVRHARAGCGFCNRPRVYGARVAPEQLRG